MRKSRVTKTQQAHIAYVVRTFTEAALKQSELPPDKNLETFQELLASFCVAVQGEANKRVKRATVSLRDQCAMAALEGLTMRYASPLTSEAPDPPLDAYAKMAYKLADAMLAARKGGKDEVSPQAAQ